MMEMPELEPWRGDNTGAAVHLSIIMPAYNEAQRIGASLHTILTY
jgi:hypothetical protein